MKENAKFLNNHFSDVQETIERDRLETWPMITTANLGYLRELFENMDGFISDAVSEAVSKGFTGYNIDFEPTDKATRQDAENYAVFLDRFADALHQHDVLLSVDIASWNEFWDFQRIANTSVDRVITMDTYAGGFETFKMRLEKAVSLIGVDKLGVGIMRVNPNTRQPLTDKELTDRFELMKKHGIQELDIWDMPIPQNYVPFLKQFRKD